MLHLNNLEVKEIAMMKLTNNLQTILAVGLVAVVLLIALINTLGTVAESYSDKSYSIKVTRFHRETAIRNRETREFLSDPENWKR